MGRLIRALIRLALVIGVTAAVIRAFKMFQGRPEGVGQEGFSFSDEGEDDPYAVDEATLGGEVSSELLDRLVCPLDKGPLELIDGKWLLNPRNGYRYPISDGIPVMLVEVGERYRDVALIREPAPSGNGFGG